MVGIDDIEIPNMAFNDPRGYSHSHQHQPYSQHHTRPPSSSHPMSLMLNNDEPRNQFQRDRSNYPLPSPSQMQQQHTYYHDGLSSSNTQLNQESLAQPPSSQYREREPYVAVNRLHVSTSHLCNKCVLSTLIVPGSKECKGIC